MPRVIEVGREKHIEGRAVEKLGEEAPGRSVGNRHVDVRMRALERGGQLVEREAQVGSRGNSHGDARRGLPLTGGACPQSQGERDDKMALHR